MRKNRSFLLLLSLVFIYIFINSCDNPKDAYEAIKSDPQSARDYIKASTVFIDVFKQVDDAMQSQKLLKSNKNVKADSCPKFIFEPGGGLYANIKMVFDSCTNEGVTYKGNIVLTMSGPMLTAGSVASITFQDLYVNGDKVTGQGTITSNGTNTSGNLVLTFQVTNGVVATSNGNIDFVTTETWTWTKGESTPWPDVSDDEYQVSGIANGKSTNGHSFTSSVSATSPLVISMACATKIINGQVIITPDVGPDMTADFSPNQTCTGKATIKISGIPDISINL